MGDLACLYVDWRLVEPEEVQVGDKVLIATARHLLS